MARASKKTLSMLYEMLPGVNYRELQANPHALAYYGENLIISGLVPSMMGIIE